MAVRSLRAGELPAAPMASRSADWLRLLAIGGVAGLLSGLFGTGGASILVPALTDLARLGQHRAQGSALAAMALVTTAAAAIYGSRGQLDLPLALGLAATAAGGAVVGARLMHRLPAGTLRRLFAGCLLLIALRLLLASLAGNAGLVTGGELAGGWALLAAGLGFAAGLSTGLLGVG